MPYAVNLNRYTILLNQKTQLVIDLFKTACDQYLKKEGTEDKSSTDLVLGDKQLRKGFFPRMLNKIENLNEKSYGANYTILPAIDNLKLDPKADKILDAYTNEINILYNKNKLKSYDMTRLDNIDSPALVFRILLLRLMTIALADDNTHMRDGEVLLKICNYFINLILTHIDEFEGEKEIFSYFPTKEHLEWLHAIRQVVLAVKLVHSHQDNITDSLTTLKSLTYTIQRMILAHLVVVNTQCKWPAFYNLYAAPKITATDLEDQFIDDKLAEYENFIIKKNKYKSINDINDIMRSTDIATFAAIEHLGRKQKNKSILDVKDICDNPQVAVLIASKNNFCPEDLYEKVESLYGLYFKSRCLLISLEQLDELITTCSWVPLIMGVINLSQISNLIRIHCEMCSELLAIPNNDIINTLPFKQKIMQKTFQAQTQLTEMHTRIKSLEELQHPDKIDKIKYHIASNINNLLEVQSALEISLLHYRANKQESRSNNLTLTQSAPQMKIMREERKMIEPPSIVEQQSIVTRAPAQNALTTLQQNTPQVTPNTDTSLAPRFFQPSFSYSLLQQAEWHNERAMLSQALSKH